MCFLHSKIRKSETNNLGYFFYLKKAIEGICSSEMNVNECLDHRDIFRCFFDYF